MAVSTKPTIYPKEGCSTYCKPPPEVNTGSPTSPSTTYAPTAAAFLDAFYGYYPALERGDYLAKYKQRSLAIGREVEVVSARGRRRALALDLDDDCHLRVRYEGGEEEWLSSGEISIRL